MAGLFLCFPSSAAQFWLLCAEKVRRIAKTAQVDETTRQKLSTFLQTISKDIKMHQTKSMRDNLLSHIKTTNEWENSGVTRAKIRKQLDAGTMVRLDRGVYAPTTFMNSLSVYERNLTRLVSVSKSLRYPVLSHDSAALWLGAPILNKTNKVHISRPTSSGYHRKDISIHGNRPESCEQAIYLEGLKVTPPQQVLFDCLETMTLTGTLCVVHYFLHQNVLTLDTAHEVLSRPRKLHAEQANIVAQRLNRQCESPLETLTWNVIYEAGLSLPEQQVWFTSRCGENFRVDFLWRDAHVILEADGKVKYSGQFGDPYRNIQNERSRQRELERQGWTVIRVEWSEVVNSPQSLIGRLRRAGVR